MIGAIPGVIGSVQAMEAIKFILGIGYLLTGRLFSFDALKMEAEITKSELMEKTGNLPSSPLEKIILMLLMVLILCLLTRTVNGSAPATLNLCMVFYMSHSGIQVYGQGFIPVQSGNQIT